MDGFGVNVPQSTRPGKRLYNELENPPMLFMGKSTISTGPCSIANCKRLPEGNLDNRPHLLLELCSPT